MPHIFEIHKGPRTRYPTQKEAEDFRVNVLYNIIDYVIDGLSCRFLAVKGSINLWNQTFLMYSKPIAIFTNAYKSSI